MLAAIMLMSTAVFAEGETDNNAQPEQTAETANESAPLIDVDATPAPIEEGEVIEEELDVSGAFQFGGFSGEQLSVNFDQNAVSLCALDDETADDGSFTDAKGIQIIVRLKSAIENQESSVNIKDLNITYSNEVKEKINTIVTEVLNSMPGEAFIYDGTSISYYTGGRTVSVNLTKKADAAGMRQTYSEEKEKVLNDIFPAGTGEMTATEIALSLHDYIALHTRYDYNSECANKGNAYGALVNGVAVCQGYGLLYKDLLNSLNVGCYLVGAELINHAWNVVQTEDGGWYNVDVTWDDPGMADNIGDITGDKDYMGYCRHDYFMKTEDEIKKSHFTDAGYTDEQYKGENGPNVYVAFDSTPIQASEVHPNTAFWSDIKCGMRYYNGTWYYNDTALWGGNLADGKKFPYMKGNICSTPYGTTRQGTTVASNAGAFALVNGKLIYAQFNGAYTDKIIRYDIASGATQTLLDIDDSTVVTEFAAGRINAANKIYGRNTVVYAVVSGGVKDTTVYKLTLDIAGDVNLDGSVDVADLWLVCNHIMKGSVLTDSGLETADMNGDGVVTVSDAVLLCNAIAGADDNEA